MRRAAAVLALGLSLDALACGEVITVQTHDGTRTRYALTVPQGPKGTLVLLPGGGGHADLDAGGCAQNLKGNSLIRSQALFQREGFATALVDAPSDYTGSDGLGGVRATPAHAEDLGKLIADVRRRVPGPVPRGSRGGYVPALSPERPGRDRAAHQVTARAGGDGDRRARQPAERSRRLRRPFPARLRRAGGGGGGGHRPVRSRRHLLSPS